MKPCERKGTMRSQVLYREIVERVFMEKFYKSSKWWELKDWVESVSEYVIWKIC